MMMALAGVAAAVAACLPVTGDRITAGDLAPAAAAFRSVPADTAIGLSPAPGVKRVFTAFELRRVALRLGVAADELDEACFEWPSTVLNAETLAAVMREGLAMPDARIEVLEFARYRVPTARPVFPRSGLAAPPPGQTRTAVLWRGYVPYGARRKLSVWARVRIVASGKRVVAREALPVGRAIEAGQLVMEEFEAFPGTERFAASIEEVTGKSPRRPVPAGSPIRVNLLDAPLDVARGQKVTVEVRSVALRLEVEALSESSGRVGDVISLRNPTNNKLFKAEIESRGRAVALASGEKETAP